MLSFTKTLTPLNPLAVEYIVIHHIAAKIATMEEIHRWHIEERGWSGIGYNEYIRKDGTSYIGRGMAVGAHTLDYNSKAYGIALEGDFNLELPTDAQKITLTKRCFELQKVFTNIRTIVAHRDLTSTDCPGKKCNINEIIISPYELALRKLMTAGIINTPDHWRLDQFKPEYVRILILKMANHLK